MHHKMLSLTIAVVMTVTVAQVAMGQDSDVCITSCLGLEAGNYQSCLGCGVYATCDVALILHDNRSCGSDKLFWDDNAKRCLGVSTTCGTVPENGEICVASCLGKEPGNYQSCQSCEVYVTCGAGGVMYDGRDCPGGMVWDDNVKNCRGASATCVSSESAGDQTSTTTPGGPAELTSTTGAK